VNRLLLLQQKHFYWFALRLRILKKNKAINFNRPEQILANIYIQGKCFFNFNYEQFITEVKTCRLCIKGRPEITSRPQEGDNNDFVTLSHSTKIRNNGVNGCQKIIKKLRDVIY